MRETWQEIKGKMEYYKTAQIVASGAFVSVLSYTDDGFITVRHIGGKVETLHYDELDNFVL